MISNQKDKCPPDIKHLLDRYEKQNAQISNIKIERKCPNCNKSYSASLGRLKWGKQTFCSRKCSYEMRGKNLQCKVQLICEVCKKQFERIPAKDTASIKVCSLKCYFSARKIGIHKTAYRPPKKTETITFVCEICKKTITILASRKGARVFRFCSLECVGKAQRGENNYFWRGGHNAYYGSNWRVQRRSAWKRDNYTCQRCLKTKNELGRNPDVHHIIPFKKFDSYLEANRLENLISLCHPCHVFVEWNGIDFEL